MRACGFTSEVWGNVGFTSGSTEGHDAVEVPLITGKIGPSRNWESRGGEVIVVVDIAGLGQVFFWCKIFWGDFFWEGFETGLLHD
jgi:hypothetical protein